MSEAVDTFELIRAHRDEILRIATEHGARNIRVFGSVARGDAPRIAMSISWSTPEHRHLRGFPPV